MADDRRELLDAALIPAGFKRRGNSYLRATPSATSQMVAYRRSRTGDGTASVYFARSADSERVEEVSPVAPFKNTFWWPEQLSDSAKESLKQQLEAVVLPYLDTFLDHYDETAAVQSLHSALEGLLGLDPPFERQDNVYFRQRGQIIDLVEVELLGQARFAFIYVAVWHKRLKGGMSHSMPADKMVPDGITRVASHTIGTNSIDKVPGTTLFFLGPSRPETVSPTSSAISICASFFEQIRNERDVLDAIRPEYRSRFPP